MELQKMEGFREPTEKETANIYQCNSSVHSFMKIVNTIFIIGEFVIGFAALACIIGMIRYHKMTLTIAAVTLVLVLVLLLADDLRDKYLGYSAFLTELKNGNFEIAHCKIDHVIRDTWYGKMAAVKIDGKRCNNLIQISSGLVNDWMRDNTMDCCIIRCHYWMGKEYVRTYICNAKDLL